MADDEVIEEVQGVSTMALTSGARAAEVLLRAAGDRALRDAHERRAESDEARRRYEAQAKVAEEFYRHAATPAFVRDQPREVAASAWRGAEKWRELEPARFDPNADRLTATIAEAYGLEPTEVQGWADTVEAGPAARPEVPEEVRRAAAIVDHQRGTDPALAAASGLGAAGAADGPARASARERSRRRAQGRAGATTDRGR